MHGGLFTSAQAVAAGMTVEQVRHRRRVGLWVPYAGAALRHRDATLDTWAEADAIALTWPDAVACLASAARLHRLPVPADLPLQAWVPHARAPRLRIQVHQFALRAEDVMSGGRIRVTTPARTVFDCLGRLPEAAAESVLVWALTRRVVTQQELEALIGAQPGLSGNARRRRLLTMTASGAMSVAEAKVHAILRLHGITGWATRQVIRDGAGIVGEADVLFPASRLVLEVDGAAYHGRDHFQADRTRQNRLVAAGFTVLRFTWADVVERPDAIAAQVRTTLARLPRDPTRELGC
jgi:very-short-patch-repair endonuclease